MSSEKISQASLGITNDVMYSLITKNIGEQSCKILDFGAGRGYMSQQVGNYLKETGKNPKDCLYAAEIVPQNFMYKEIECKKISTDSIIPFDDEFFDIIYAIEVIEHMPRPYEFLYQAFAKLKKGGCLIFSTPNILHLTSRWQFLLTGYPTMYEALSAYDKNAGEVSGHIMPLSYNNFHYGLRKAGYSSVELSIDRRKSGSIILAILMYPFLKLASLKIKSKLRRVNLELFEENIDVIGKINSLDILTSRSCIIVAKK